MRTAPASLSLFLCALGLRAADPPPADARNSSGQVVAAPVPPGGRAVENLAGQVDTSRGESRRNENVQVNLVDTNAARELNARIGASATIVDEFRADRGYF